jgi:hypothetical protein
LYHFIVFRANGKQPRSKHAKRGQKKASKSNFHEEVANESSDAELPNPEETTISDVEINSGNVT